MKREFGFFAVAVLTICLVYFAFLRSGSNPEVDPGRTCEGTCSQAEAARGDLFIPAGVVYLVFGALAVSPILAEERLRRREADRSPRIFH